MGQQKDDPNWGMLLSAGIQVLVGVGVGVVIGSWLDQRYHWSPWGVIVGCLLGVSGGMYLLIKDTMRMNKD